MPTILNNGHGHSADIAIDASLLTVPASFDSTPTGCHHSIDHPGFTSEDVPLLSHSPSLSMSPPRTPMFPPSTPCLDTPSQSPALSAATTISTSTSTSFSEDEHATKIEPSVESPSQLPKYNGKESSSISIIAAESLSFSLATHPAVVYASERLSDQDYTSKLHTVKVFDFDHTLFRSPLPNPALWDPSFLGILTSWNYCGTGWWHNPGTLELGPEVEATCWEGWWNEEIVREVRKSSEDPGCLTVLLTGRNGPTFGEKLVEMVGRKGLDFDLIAIKPTTVARIESKLASVPTNGGPQSVERYLKVHTFNTKHEFLYNLLFEYPSIRSMFLWDDRPCQVAKFRQVGQEWLEKKLLDNFDITVVQEPLLFMDPQREIDLVLAMVEANNQQVDIEVSGGPFLVPGVGAIPKTRPELEGLNIWDPYETYVPQIRRKIELTDIVRYTGIMFSATVQSIMKQMLGIQEYSNGYPSTAVIECPQWIKRPSMLRGQDLSKWVVPDDLHVTLCLGSASKEHLESVGGLNATVLVEVEALGEFEGRVWALKVKEFNTDEESNVDTRQLQIIAPNGQIYSSLDALRTAYASYESAGDELYPQVDLKHLGHLVSVHESTPHITMAYDRLNGTRAVDSGRIIEWEPLENASLSDNGSTRYPYRLVFVGTIGEKKLLGMKTPKASDQHIPKAEVSVANIIKSLTGDKQISGKELGEMVRCVKEDMERLSVENRLENEERIAIIAQEICDRVETKKCAAVQHHGAR
ncbi:hypothetical protein BX616_003098 [Lobosporangium transversale]|uniref:Swiss Army Knife RNA repair protein HAD domain-containing protein n=1 Tax=Lobosporangium transversale TaxID=64571 RepID=A0A1Y2H511_9FUNG|nr:hypothetical protein BCR41DRAFT_418142 [Lobosporangium transversale]KAF9899325.1 hypothetical protein BX616_003098 [Lobosporangium transversale]ORZ29071.1 hypothetical protein BCR41DRAFT_418142 [Lobosporangium transversale]|eukprot:XP_021886744.1 hypothetical protein BCR41DRAFT_418142 [Lobosporangium transversale]